MTKDEVLDIIYEGIDDINEELPKNRKLDKNPGTILFGKDGQLDSLSLVNLIVSIEGLIETKFDKSIVIANEKAMSMMNSPFRAVSTLADYLMTIMV